MLCKEAIINLMNKSVVMTAYEISKEINFSYSNTHKYCRELFDEEIIEIKKIEFGRNKAQKLFYGLKEIKNGI